MSALPQAVEAVDAPATYKAYILRTCAADMSSYGGFIWPTEGYVAAPDWRDTRECGFGLHGFLMGEGDGSLASWDPDAKWIVAGINEWVELDGKVKAPEAWVVHCGDRLSAVEYIKALGATGAIVGGTATAGDRGTATAGDRGTATAGIGGTATAGVGGTATAGVGGTATAGYGGTATAGDRGTATAGYGGTVLIRFYDAAASRCRVITGYVGEDGIKPNTRYRVVGGKLVEAR